MDEQGETGPEDQLPLMGRSGHRRFWASLGLALFAMVLTLVGLGLSGRSIPLPGALVHLIESRANRDLGGRAVLRIGDGDLVVTSEFRPQVRLGEVALVSPGGQRLALISDLRTTLDGRALMRGQVVPAHVRIKGARVAVRRMPDGTLDIAPGAQGFSGTARAPSEILDAIDAAFSQPNLAQLTDVTVVGLAVLFDDRRAGQIWTIDGGNLRITPSADRVEASLSFDAAGQTATGLFNKDASLGDAPMPAAAHADLTLSADKHSSQAAFTADLSRVSARDLAGQVPALAWLGALDAPITGRVRSGFDAAGNLAPLDVALDVGKGVLQPTADTRPVAFDGADLAMTYDPARAALTLTELKIESPALRATLTGGAELKGFRDGIPEALVAQIRLSDLKADPEGLFSDPLTIADGAMDVKLTLDPFALRIGQLTLADQGRKISARGLISAQDDGWSVALDFGMDAIETSRLLALWPLSAVPRTRSWIAENVATGELFDVKGALRLAPGQEPRLALGYQFRGAEVRFMRTLPPIVDGAGYATISDNAYVLVTEKGRIRAPQGGDLDIAGSVLKVPDMRLKPAPMEITLKSESSVTAALAILDQPPFGFLTRAGQPVDLAEGRARLTSVLKFTPKKKLVPQDVAYDVTGTLSSVRSDRIVKGRTLQAQALTVRATSEGLSIEGAATLDGAPLTGRWSQRFGPEGRGKSQVAGRVELSPAVLDRFGIALPDGAVAGRGQGAFTIALERGTAPVFRLTSDLAGLRLAIPEVGWTKPAEAKGALTIEGRFARPTEVDRLTLKAEGLSADGKITLKPDGTLDQVSFAEVSRGDWFKGGVTIKGQGKGKAAAVAITGGEADMRRATFGGSAGGGDRPPLTVRLDRLRVSQGIAIGGFDGTFGARGKGLQGTFTGNVNDKAPVSGEVVPDAEGRAAFRIRSDDAGLTLAAAGLYGSGRGGRLNLILRPRADKGTYDGTAQIFGIRVVNAPGLAGLLNAISVVGLINELQGAGIVFTDVEGHFLLTPAGVEIRQGSAVGPSLGVSLAGAYWSADDRIDLQGVISPIYILNGIGQIFSRQRDGLFGFSYTLKGTRDQFKVGVNPLSILTPGMFREIFRKAPPKIKGEQTGDDASGDQGN